MSHESRTVRPFRGTSLDDALTDVKFHFGNEVCEAAAGITVEDPDSFACSRACIVWAPEGGFEDFKETLQRGAEDLDVEPSALGLLAVASTSYIKRAEVVYRCLLTELDSLARVTDITEVDRPVALRTGHHGAVVEVYLLLLAGQERRPLRPWRKGTWISRAKFRIDVDNGAELFHLTPLDDDERDRLGLPSKTVRYVDLEDHDILEPFGDSEPPRFYVDDVFLGLLTARQKSAGAVALQAQLVQDFAAAVILNGATNNEVGTKHWEDVEESLLGKVLRFAADPGASLEDRQSLLKKASESPDRIIAQLEHRLDIGKRLIGSLKAES